MFPEANRSRLTGAASVLFACSLLIAPTLPAQTRIEPRPADISTDLGRAQPATPITLTVHLNMHEAQGFNDAVKALYTPGSSNYHHWMSAGDIARYAPTTAEVQAVTSALKSYGVSVLSVSKDNLSIRARGPAASVESAFQTEIHQFTRNGATFHANVTPASLIGPAASLVRGVTGLTSLQMKPFLKYQVNPRTGQRIVKQSSGGFSDIATNDCFLDPSSVTLTTAGADLPFAVYVGNTYIPNSGGAICSWTPSQLQAHYGLTAAYAQGLDGTGQTIVIVDGPSDGAQLQSDLAQFSTLAGLPAITSSNFTVLYPDGQPTPLQINIDNWQTEASLDVEWAHSIAPGAKIVIEIMPTAEFAEFEFAIDYARENALGNVISNSYGSEEVFSGPFTVQGFEQVLETAAAAGIAVNFASGDSGDNALGSPSAGGVSYPASSAFGTSVGGTSIGIPNGSGGTTEVGWGTDSTVLSESLTSVLDPPFPLTPGDVAPTVGSGGGASTFIAKPAFQQSLSGTARSVPDIAADADPLTGVVFVQGGVAESGIGGTSLACPIFSAFWAIAAQAAGGGPLGQAAPLLYTLPETAINDVVPVSSPDNVAGILVDSNGETDYSGVSLLPPLYSTTQFYSTLWDQGGGFYMDMTFGTDSSLTVTPGWDNVTGLGVPNGLAFINAVAAAK